MVKQTISDMVRCYRVHHKSLVSQVRHETKLTQVRNIFHVMHQSVKCPAGLSLEGFGWDSNRNSDKVHLYYFLLLHHVRIYVASFRSAIALTHTGKVSNCQCTISNILSQTAKRWEFMREFRQEELYRLHSPIMRYKYVCCRIFV